MNRSTFRIPLLALLAVPLVAQEGAPGPGPEHQLLQRFVGTWDITVKNYAEPGGEPMTMTGTDVTTAACNGMWIVTKVTGHGMPFSGMGFTGWDAPKQQYVGVWVDSMSASPSQSQGTFDKKSSSLHLTGTMATPMGMVKTRSECTFPDADTRVEKSWMVDAEGKETLSMEITFQRQKGGAKPAPAAASKGEEMMGMDPKTKMHAHLAAYVGEWDAMVSMDMPGMPAGEPQPMTQVDALVCGGLWVHTNATSSFMGQPFEGHGLLGYDPTKKQFVSFWVDNFAPYLMQSAGTCDEGGKAFTLTGEALDMTGTPCTSTDRTTFADKDHRKMEMKSTTKDGKDAGSMTIDYTRKK